MQNQQQHHIVNKVSKNLNYNESMTKLLLQQHFFNLINNFTYLFSPLYTFGPKNQQAIQNYKYLKQSTFQMDSEEIAIQNFISYIKSISLHFENLFAPTQIDLKGITSKTFKLINDFQKFVSEYNLKVLKEIQNAKISVPLIFYRSIKDKINEPNFMRYRYKHYELKFVFIRINLQCHTHVQICKNINGVKKSCVAFEKLQNSFIYMLQKKMNEENQSQKVSVKFFQQNAISFLQEIYQLMNGQILCSKCRKVMSYHSQLMIVMPPTVRIQNYKQKRDFESDFNHPPKYLHENCI